MEVKSTTSQDIFQWGQHTLHKSWQTLLSGNLKQITPPQEKKAACLSCPKVKSAGFLPGIKCCTYHPKVPHYLLGFALKSQISASEQVRQVLQAGYLLPEGSGHTPLQWMDVMRTNQAQAYGRNQVVVCKFLDQSRGQCGIYAFRNAACSTYFCDYDEAWGENFWEFLHHYMGRLELALTQWALEKVGFDFVTYTKRFKALAAYSPQEVCDPDTKAWTRESLTFLWHDWVGREEELYLKCAEAIVECQDLLGEAKKVHLIEPNLLEVSSMEARYRVHEEHTAVEPCEEENERPVDFGIIEERLHAFCRRLQKKGVV